MQNYSSRVKIFILLLILAIAAVFRFYQLDEFPPGLYPDVAINGNEAITNPGKVFYPENNGREGLFINLISLSFALFGISIWSIKAVAAFFGTLTVLGTYLLTKELFSSETMKQGSNEAIALLTSFFLAISFWHVNFSRLGFRAILLPFILVFAFYFLFRGIRTKKIAHFISAGVLFGLGFYTYTSFRMAVLLLPLPILYFWFLSRAQNLQKKFLFSIFYFLLSIFIVSLPIGFYFLQHPADFASRAAPISVFAQENPLKAFGESFIRHLAMFNIYGDPNWRHNLAGSPQLLWPVGILFIIGIATAIKELIKIIGNKNWSLVIGHWSSFLFAWLFIMLLPGALTYEGLPHALRTIGVIPVPYIFAAIGGWQVWQWISAKNVHKKLLLFFTFFFLFILAFAEYNKYFLVWGKSKEVEGAFTKYYVDIGDYLNSLPEGTKKYVIVNEPGVPVPFPNGLPMPAQTVMFIEWRHPEKPQSTYLRPEELDKITSVQQFVVIPMKSDEALFGKLKQKFPKGEIKKEGEISLFTI